MKANTKRKTDESKTLMWQAWHIASLSKQKELPSLPKLLKRMDQRSNPEKKKQDPETLYSLAKIFNQAFGGETVKREELNG